jgi:glycine cleavage system H protein
MIVPDDLRYTKDHEWVKLEGSRIRVGITDYAQDALGDIVFVQLPELGTSLDEGQSLSEVESTKSVSDIYAPLKGTIAEVNADLVDAPQRLNEDPYGDGWICIIEPDDSTSYNSLLDADAYRRLIED